MKWNPCGVWNTDSCFKKLYGSFDACMSIFKHFERLEEALKWLVTPSDMVLKPFLEETKQFQNFTNSRSGRDGGIVPAKRCWDLFEKKAMFLSVYGCKGIIRLNHEIFFQQKDLFQFMLLADHGIMKGVQWIIPGAGQFIPKSFAADFELVVYLLFPVTVRQER